MGIIDTLSSGFDLLRKRPYLVLVPILLDLLLVFGPRVSIQPIVESTREVLEDSIESTSDLLAVDDTDALLLQYDLIADAASRYNLLALVPVSSIVIPSIAGALPINLEADNVLFVSGVGQAVGIGLGALLIGLFLACIYWGLIAQDIRGQHTGPMSVFRAAPGYWVQILKFVLILLIIALGIAGLFFLASALATLLMMTGLGIVASLVILLVELLAFMAASFMLVYLYFVPQAITITQSSTREAIKTSMVIVRVSFGPAIGIILLTALIRAGMSYLWAQLAVSTAGMLAAIAGNAVIGTGLIIATFVFFRDRFIAIRDRMAEGSMVQSE